MATSWERNPGDVAWNPDKAEAEALLVAFVLVRRTTTTATRWRLGFEVFFVGRGMAVTHQAMENINFALARLHLPALVFRDDGPGRSFAQPEVQAFERGRFLEGLEGRDYAWLCAEYSRRVESIRSAAAGQEAPAVEARPDPVPDPISKPGTAPAVPPSPWPRGPVEEAIGVVVEEWPTIDEATVRVLMSYAPDSATLAWLSAYLPRPPRTGGVVRSYRPGAGQDHVAA